MERFLHSGHNHQIVATCRNVALVQHRGDQLDVQPFRLRKCVQPIDEQSQASRAARSIRDLHRVFFPFTYRHIKMISLEETPALPAIDDDADREWEGGILHRMWIEGALIFSLQDAVVMGKGSGLATGRCRTAVEGLLILTSQI